MIRCYKEFSTFVFLILLMQGVLIVPRADASSPPPFTVDAKAAVLLDALSGQVIFEQNSQESIAPASLAKILTLYIAYEDLKRGTIKLDDQVLVSKKAWATQGSKMFIKVGERVALQRLLEGIASVSGNDACIAVAEYVAGLEEAFVVRMNEKARSLGMIHSHFCNAHGLPADDQYTTASDMGMLAYHYLKDYPEALRIHSIKQFTSAGITQYNRNGLLWLDEGVDGLKTGWIDHNGGFHLIATAKRDDQRFIAIVMGARNRRTRENEALKLLNYGFKNFSTVTLFKAGESIAQVSVWKGVFDNVFLTAAASGSVTVPRGDEQSLSLVKNIPTRIFAPIKRGERIGTLEITKKGELLERVDLIAQDEVPRARVITRFLHTAMLSFMVPPYWGYLLVLVLFFIARAVKRMRGSSQSPLSLR